MAKETDLFEAYAPGLSQPSLREHPPDDAELATTFGVREHVYDVDVPTQSLAPRTPSRATQTPGVATDQKRSPASGRGNAFAQERLVEESATRDESAVGDGSTLLEESAVLHEPSARAGEAGPGEDWIAELMQQAPVPASGGGAFAGVIEEIQAQVPDQQAPAFELPPGTRILVDESGGLRVWPSIRAEAVAAQLAAAQMTLEDLRPLAEPVSGSLTPRPTPGPGGSGKPSQTGGKVSTSGAADLNRLASAASRPWYGSPKGKCYRAVAGYDSNSYMNRAGGRWEALASRIPSDHAMWAVSFAHWLQETSHGRKAAAELGFTILESDGKTKLGDFLAARPDLRGSIVVVPFGQEGTASQEWNAAANYGSSKWGKGVGDIAVVSEIGAKGATYVADGKVPHNNATMWWLVHPN